LAQAFLAGGAAGADGVWTAKEAAAIIGASEAGRALEVELAGLADRGAQVLDAERVDGAVAIGQAGAVGFRAAAIPKVAFESGRAVSVRAALGDGGDVTAAIGTLTVAPNRAIAVGYADLKIVSDTTVCLEIAERVERTIEVALTGELNFALHRLRSVDGAAGKEQYQGEKRHRA
jgi:hypothetical protein